MRPVFVPALERKNRHPYFQNQLYLLCFGALLARAVDFVTDAQREFDFIQISIFYVEFIVGICMFFIVAGLVVFRLKEIEECWNLHVRIRFYFVLTIIGTAVNLGLGICGTINVLIEEPA